MAEGFQELGIRPELVEMVDTLGYDAPTPLQRAAVPVLRRGGNAVLYAAAGSGVVAAYGLALIDRLASGEAGAGAGEGAGEGAGALRALVLLPTPETATCTAAALARMARAADVAVAALGPGWATPAREAAVIVATPATALEAVRTSVLKLGGVETLVLDGLSTFFTLEAQDAVEALTDAIPRAAQRVVTTAARTAAVKDYVERHVRRALHIPPIPTEVETPAPAVSRPLAYMVAGADAKKTEALARYLAGREAAAPIALYCRNEERARSVADALVLRGFRAGRGASGDARLVVLTADEAAPADAYAISYDVPFDSDTLASRHGGGGLVLVEARELPHLRQIAERAAFAPHAEPVATEAPALAGVASFRTRLESALAEEDLGAQLLVLEPLFERHAAAEVAAAASALLRRRKPAAPAAAPSAPPPPAGAPAPAAYVRLFVGVGSRDGVRPADLVGAITGEAQVGGEQIGRIEIRDNFSIVEVENSIADRVIRAVNGTTLKGRSVRVDYDRRPSGERPRRPSGERPRRRTRESGR